MFCGGSEEFNARNLGDTLNFVSGKALAAGLAMENTGNTGG